MSQVEEFKKFRKKTGASRRYTEDVEKSLKIEIGPIFDDRIFRLFEISKNLKLDGYLQLLDFLKMLHNTSDSFENFFKLSKFNQFELYDELRWSSSFPGLAVILNLTGVNLTRKAEVGSPNFYKLIESIENNAICSKSPNYRPATEPQDVSLAFHNLSAELSEFEDPRMDYFTYGFGFTSIAYILRSLLGEDAVLEFLNRIVSEDYRCNSEVLVKMAINYSTLKDYPLEWIESVASGLTIESMKDILNISHSNKSQLSVSNN